MTDNLVEIFVMSRNRLDYVVESIDSVLNQSYRPMVVRISDNSTDERVAKFLSERYPQLEIRRRANLSSYAHLNAVFDEIRAPFFMIFHDDDVLEPNAVDVLVKALIADPDLSAVAANARVIHGERRSDERLNPTLTRDRTFTDPEAIVDRYFDFSLGVNPFPGYLYRTSKVGDLRFDELSGGQYSDLTFIAELCRRGPILWLAAPLMRYRKHGLNHSATVSVLSAKKAIRYLESKDLIRRHSARARLFRYWNHFFYVKNTKGRVVSARQKRLVATYFARHPFGFLRKSWQKLRLRIG